MRRILAVLGVLLLLLGTKLYYKQVLVECEPEKDSAVTTEQPTSEWEEDETVVTVFREKFLQIQV